MGQPDSRVLLLWDGTESANRNARPRYPAKPGRFGCNIESAALLPVLQPHEGGQVAGGITRVGDSHRGDSSADLKSQPGRAAVRRGFKRVSLTPASTGLHLFLQVSVSVAEAGFSL